MQKIRVSVVINTFNRPDFLRKALESALNQTHKVYEILVIDNSSKENANENKKIIDSLKDDRIKYYFLKIDYGAPYARNYGIEKARGKYIAFLDDDDEWLPSKIEKQLKEFDNDTIGLISCKSQNKELYLRNLKRYEEKESQKSIIVPYRSLLKFYNLGTTSTFLVKRDVFEKVGGFDIIFPAAQDHELGLRIAKNYQVKIIPETLTLQNTPINHIGINFKKRIKGHIYLYRKYSKEFKKLGFRGAVLQRIKIVIWLFILSFGLISEDKAILILGSLQELIYSTD